MTRTFHIREQRLIKVTDKVYVFTVSAQKGSKQFTIPKGQVTNVSHYLKKTHKDRGGNEKWLKITVTDWIWNQAQILSYLKPLLKEHQAHIEGQKTFGIDWDKVIIRKLNPGKCFYCDVKLYKDKGRNKGNWTKDHIIPKTILTAYGISMLSNNTVDCCRECNGLKTNLHPEIFLQLIRRKEMHSGNKKYKQIREVLEDIVIPSHNYGINENNI